MGDSDINRQIWAERWSKRGYFWGCSIKVVIRVDDDQKNAKNC